MRRQILLFILLFVVFASQVGAKTAFSLQDVERLLQRMTLEEKIGQMLQLRLVELACQERYAGRGCR